MRWRYGSYSYPSSVSVKGCERNAGPSFTRYLGEGVDDYGNYFGYFHEAMELTVFFECNIFEPIEKQSSKKEVSYWDSDDLLGLDNSRTMEVFTSTGDVMPLGRTHPCEGCKYHKPEQK